MNSLVLSVLVDEIVTKAQDRILGPGHEQYAGIDAEGNAVQGFETMDLDDLITFIEEEALDLINYGVMLAIRIDRVRQAHTRLRKLRLEQGE